MSSSLENTKNSEKKSKDEQLMEAIHNEDVGAVNALMENPKEINIAYRNDPVKKTETFIMKALLTKNSQIINKIISHPDILSSLNFRANIDHEQIDRNDINVLEMAYMLDNQEAVEKLIKLGATIPNFQIKETNNKAVRYIINVNNLINLMRKNDMNKIYDYINQKLPLHFYFSPGITPLEWFMSSEANLTNKKAMATLFFKNGVDPNAVYRNSQTLLQRLISSTSFNSAVILLSMADLSQTINHQDSEGNTALHLACQHGNLTLIEALLKQKADINITNKRGETVIHSLFSTNKLNENSLFQAYKYLIAKGAEKNTKDKSGNTPLSLAISSKALTLAKEIYSDLEQKEKEEVLLQENSDGDLPLIRVAFQTNTNNFTVAKSKEAFEFIKYCLAPFDNKTKLNLLTKKNKMNQSVLSTLAECNLNMFFKLLSMLKGHENSELTPKELMEIYIDNGIFSILIKKRQFHLLNEILERLGDAFKEVLLSTDSNKSLIYQTIKTNQNQLFITLLKKLTPSEKIAAFIWSDNVENSPLMLILKKRNYELLNIVLVELGLKKISNAIIYQGKTAIINALAEVLPQAKIFVETKEDFEKRVQNSTMVELFTEGDEPGVSQKLKTVKEELRAAVMDPVLLYGPLPKSQHTYDLERIVKLILKGNKHVVEKDPHSQEYFITINLGLRAEKHNLSQILKYANLQHIILDEEDKNNYVDFAKNNSIIKPEIDGDIDFPSEENFKERDIDGTLKNTSYAEQLAINVYTGNDNYRAMNKCLSADLDAVDIPESESGSQSISEILIHSVMACSGLNTLPDSTITSTFRWENALPEKVARIREQGIKNDQGLMMERGFLSTSFANPSARFFSERTRYGLMFTGGLVGKNVAAVSQFSNENEFLIPPAQLLFQDNFQIKTDEGQIIDFYKVRAVRTLTNLPAEAQVLAANISERELNHYATIALIFLDNLNKIEAELRAKNYDPELLTFMTEFINKVEETLKGSEEIEKLGHIEELLTEAQDKIDELPIKDINSEQKMKLKIEIQRQLQTVSQANIDNCAITILRKTLDLENIELKYLSNEVIERLKNLIESSRSLLQNETHPPLQGVGNISSMVRNFVTHVEQQEDALSKLHVEVSLSHNSLVTQGTIKRNNLDNILAQINDIKLNNAFIEDDLADETLVPFETKKLYNELLQQKQKLILEVNDIVASVMKVEEMMTLCRLKLDSYSELKGYLQQVIEGNHIINGFQDTLNRQVKERLSASAGGSMQGLFFSKPKLQKEVEINILNEALKFNNPNANPAIIQSLKEKLGIGTDETVLRVNGTKIQIMKGDVKTWKDIPTLYNEVLKKPKPKASP